MSTAHNPALASILLFRQAVASTAPAVAQAASTLRGSVFDRVVAQPGVKSGKQEIKIALPKGQKQRMKGLRP